MPIKNIGFDEQKEYVTYVESISSLNKKLSTEINSFHKWLNRTFNIEKLSKKLEKYYELTFEDFLKEIKKHKIDITKRKTQELLETEFNNSINIVKPLQNEINELDKKINHIVYKLYGLTTEEINLIEENLK